MQKILFRLTKQLQRLLVIVMVGMTCAFTAISEASAAQLLTNYTLASHTPDHNSIDRNAKDTTSSDLSNIPNLEQMNPDTFEEYFGNQPGNRKPLFNPDDGKNVQVKDKTPGSNAKVKPEDMNKPVEATKS